MDLLAASVKVFLGPMTVPNVGNALIALLLIAAILSPFYKKNAFTYMISAAALLAWFFFGMVGEVIDI